MAFQGLFRRHNTFVVVKPVRLSAKETLEVGTVIDMKRGNVKWFQLRLWFRRRRIGTQDSNWVNQILDGARRPEGAAISTKHDIQNLVDTLVEVGGIKAIGLETLEGAQELSGAKVADATIEPAKVDEPAATEPELTAEQKKQAKKDKRNAARRAATAAKNAAKAGK